MSLPSTRTSPVSGVSRPSRISTSVLLPVPLGPIIPTDTILDSQRDVFECRSCGAWVSIGDSTQFQRCTERRSGALSAVYFWGGEIEFYVHDIKHRQAVAQRLHRTQHSIDRWQKTKGGCGEQAQRGQYGCERTALRQHADHQYGEATDRKQF